MKFRPCIDIHNGKVKQIVGGSLKDQGDQAAENFVSEQDAAFYAELYKKAGLKGGHVILLNGKDSPNYEATKAQALLALKKYPGGLQIGGGICPENVAEYLEAGASHVIVTSYVFKNGVISWENLEKIRDAAGKEHLVLDLSCRKKDGNYYIVTDRWQKFTEETVTLELMEKLGSYCDEFLVHAVDVEGKAHGVETELAELLGLGTMTTRFLPFIIFPEGKEPPAVITYLGKVLPYAVIGLLVVFCLKDVPGSTHIGLPELIAILFIVALHKWKKSTLLSIGGGTVLYMVLVQTIFG